MYWVIGELGLCIISHNYWTVVVVRTINCTQASWRVEVKRMLLIFLVVSCQIVKKNVAFISFSLFLMKTLKTCRFVQIVRWGLRKNWQLLALSNLQHNFLWHFIFWMDHTILTILNKTWLINEKLKWPFISFHVSWKLQCR